MTCRARARAVTTCVSLLAAASATIAATATATATAGATPQIKRLAGVVPDLPTRTSAREAATGTSGRDIPTRTHAGPIARVANLPYQGGPVMHSNRTHVIFWQPGGSTLTYDPGYQSQVEMFLTRVAADSRMPTNVYSLSGQYRDAGGPAAYDSSFAGAVVSTDPLPHNGCTAPATGPAGWNVCLDDAQLEAEIEHEISKQHFPSTMRDIYFLVMPNGMGTCETTGPENCALGGSAAGSFCGYHSSTPDGSILYAVIPYNAVPGHCQSGNPRPNASTADPALSTLSHEHNETVTDPLGDAWIDSSGNENGDLCIAQYGPDLGGSGASTWNEAIHGGHYFLQEEWSNEDGQCKPRDEADPVSFSVRGRISARSAATFTGRASDPDGSIVAFDWSFGDGAGAHRRVVSHAFSRPGSYRVTLRVTNSAGNRAYSVRTIRVVSPGQDLKRPSRRTKARRR